MLRYRMFTPMGGNAGEIELAIPTIQPGETIRPGDGRKLLVLDAAYDLPEDRPFRRLLTVEDVG